VEETTMETAATIGREELQDRLGRGDAPALVMAASDFGFRAKHIPGSVHFDTHGTTLPDLPKDREIVVYCSNADCIASSKLYKKLRENGYQQVRHYVGGLIDWESAGLPLEGDWATGPSP
jgi:rhodanese-related sulfurtransferase